MVFSPHPDDDIIGCGGSISKHIHEGAAVKIVYMTSGEAAASNLDDLARIREEEARKGALKLGVSDLVYLRQPDGGLFCISPELVEKIENILTQYRPQLIYIPHSSDDHHDHQATFCIITTILKTAKMKNILFSDTTVLCYEVWTPLQHFTHITDTTIYADLKLDALKEHHSQLALVNYVDGVQALNRFRAVMFGAQQFPQCRYCECFLLFQA